VSGSAPDRILVVEDDLTLRMTIACALRDAGFQVWQTGSATVASAAVSTCAPDVILLDAELQDGNGFVLYDEVRRMETGHDVPVIFMSGARLDEEAVVKALAAGAIDYMRKPFGVAELVARVTVALRTRRAQLDLVRLSTTDPLTGLLNRRAFFEAMERERRRAERVGLTMSVAILDIDHFKCVNDEHGHAAGDRVLTAIGRIVREQVRTTDVAGRIGGEELAFVLCATDGDGAFALAEKLRASISACAIDVGVSIKLNVTASVGVATAAGHQLQAPDSAVTLLAGADAALYAAKRAGRNRVAIASGSSTATAKGQPSTGAAPV
jgi:diguanylate cyclase (GGDEF)-like protein